MSDAAAYRFGPFCLDPADRRLTREGIAVEVSARYLDALILLVAEGGRLVTKDRFMDEVWRGIPVTDEALTQCIRSLRRALEDDASAPRFIETVPRHGYRFSAAVEACGIAAQAPSLAGERTTRLVSQTIAGAIGGGLAGVVAALAYVSAGMIGPGVGAASTLLVLLSINLLLGGIAGGAIGLSIAFVASRTSFASAWIVAAGATAGLIVGALGQMVGHDLFALLFGRSPGLITGGREGLLVGAATGAGVWIAALFSRRGALWRSAPAPVLGLCAGMAITAWGGRLMVGSLAQLATRFPDSRLSMSGVFGEDGVGPMGLLLATSLECALFAGFTALAIVTARRLGGARAE
jgi:DNA-binding winged helix-turn-helix (wHTH) protein